MKIKMLTLAAGPEGVTPPGSIIDIDEATARQLIRGCYAIAMEADMVITRQPPAVEPLSLEEVKLHLRNNPGDTSEDKDIIAPLISAAREYCENYCGKSFAEQSITAYPEVSGTMTLPRGPVISVDSVTVDGEAVEYTADVRRGTVTVNKPGAVITYTAGYEETPYLVRQAMLLLIGHWYTNREAVIQGSTTEIDIAVRAMLNQYKGWWF